MDFNNFNRNSNLSSREKLEIGESGKSRGEEKAEKNRERDLKNRGRGRGRGMRGRSSGGGTSISFKLIGTIIFWGFMIFVLFALNSHYKWVDLDFNQKLSMEEGYTSFVNSTKDVHHSAGVNSGMVEERDSVYQENTIYDGSGVLQLQDDIYLLYVYTLESDKDELFNLFVESYGEDVPVYTAYTHEITQDIGYNYLGENTDRTLTDPHFIMYEHVDGAENEPLEIYYEEDLEYLIPEFNENSLRHQDEDEGFR